MQIKSTLVSSKKLLQAEASIFHLLFYGFLRLSHSYQLAHKFKNNELNYEDNFYIPKDFDLVQKKYELFGDVINQSFEAWWLEGGNKLFQQNVKSKKVILDINLAKTEGQTIKEISKLINLIYSRNQEVEESILIPKNKIQTNTLISRMETTMAVSYALKFNRKFSHWQIAAYLKMDSKYLLGLDPTDKLTSNNEEARQELTKFITKNVNESMIISENVARGIFPSLDKNSNALRFDHHYINKILNPIYSNLHEIALHTSKNQINKDLGHKIFKDALKEWYSLPPKQKSQ